MFDLFYRPRPTVITRPPAASRRVRTGVRPPPFSLLLHSTHPPPSPRPSLTSLLLPLCFRCPWCPCASSPQQARCLRAPQPPCPRKRGRRRRTHELARATGPQGQGEGGPGDAQTGTEPRWLGLPHLRIPTQRSGEPAEVFGGCFACRRCCMTVRRPMAAPCPPAPRQVSPPLDPPLDYTWFLGVRFPRMSLCPFSPFLYRATQLLCVARC